MIEIIGLGPGGLGQLPVENLERLRQAKNLWLRTGRHPVADDLSSQGVNYQTFDELYQQAGEFDELYHEIVQQLKEMSLKGPITYAVPGHPLIAEKTVKMLFADEQVEIRIYAAMSCIDTIFAAIGIDPVDSGGVAIVDALTLDNAALLPSRSMLLLQTYNRQVCSDLKLTLMDSYPDDTQVCLIKAAGVSGQERISWLPLYQLDRQSWVDHLTSVYVPAVGEEQSCLTPLDPLTEIMSQLRSDNGCPWDKEQNHRSLRRYVIEEAYEVADAIDLGDMNKLCEELGDLLLQVVFHAHIAEENRQFDMNDVIKEIVAKMIRRHPHVFDNIEVHDAGEVIHNWEEIKAKEREGLGDTGIINVPMAMPSLMLAEKVQSQVSRVGFDWDKPQEALKKVTEEVNELLAVIETGNMARIREEMGDMLFAAVNVSRLLKLEPEEVLKEAVGKFIRRFRYMEQEVKQQNVSMRALSLDQLEELWQKSKQEIG